MKQSSVTHGHNSAKPTNGNGTLLNGNSATATLSKPRSAPPQAEALVASLMAVVRDMLIVDDAASDLPLRQVRVCMILSNGPQSMSSLSRELGVSLSAITQIADRLETAGLVTRVAEGSDRRVRRLQLTPLARKMMLRRHRIKVERAQAALRQMGPQDRKRIMKSLALLQQVCQESRKL